MGNKNILKKKILYRSKHRGFKEMDLLLGNFVNKYINLLDEVELKNLESLLEIDDEILYKWYLNKNSITLVPVNNVSKKLREFKIV
jgi:antitoxin CptB